MLVKYNDLHSLIFQDRNARQYYNELPKHIREHVNSRASSITSYESLKDYAKSFLSD